MDIDMNKLEEMAILSDEKVGQIIGKGFLPIYYEDNNGIEFRNCNKSLVFEYRESMQSYVSMVRMDDGRTEGFVNDIRHKVVDNLMKLADKYGKN